MKRLLFALTLAAASIFAQDAPSINAQAFTNDPAYNPPFPGLAACGNTCYWGIQTTALTADSSTVAFTITVDYQVDGDPGTHEITVTVPVHDTAGVKGGEVFTMVGFTKITSMKVVRWMRVTQIS